ncbi:hypothetical protein JL721_6855 [Aureococcus anophagefferens]|nr:hypothetical protein JL721_6855 [Aureococcus anophagefferens]
MAPRESLEAEKPLYQRPWWELWDGLRDAGWSKAKLGREYRFVRPGCASCHGDANLDWFASPEDVAEFAADQELDGEDRAGELEWWELWDALKDGGWSRGGPRKKLFVAPGASLEGVEGLDWFASPDAVVGHRKTSASAPRPRTGLFFRPGPDGAGGAEGLDFTATARRGACRLGVGVDGATGALREDELALNDAASDAAERDGASDDEDAMRRESLRRMSCPNEALGLTDTPRWPIFDNSPVDYKGYGGRDDRPRSRPGSRRNTDRKSQAPKESSDSPRDLWDLPWGELWPELKELGWAWVQGLGLEERRYLRPGAPSKKSAQRLGRDYFRDAADVVDFLRQRRVDGVDIFGHVGEDGPSPRDDERKAVTEPSEAEPEEAEEAEAAAASSSSDDEAADAGPALWQRSPKEVWKELRKHGWKWANGSLEYDYHYVRPGARKGRAAVLGVDYFGTEAQVIAYVRRARVDLVRRFGHVDEDGDPPSPSSDLESAAKRAQGGTKRVRALARRGDGGAKWTEPFNPAWAELRELGWEWRYGKQGATHWVRPGLLDGSGKWRVGEAGRTGDVREAPPKPADVDDRPKRGAPPKKNEPKAKAPKEKKLVAKARKKIAKREAANGGTGEAKRKAPEPSPSEAPLWQLPVAALWLRLKKDHGWADARGDALRNWFHVRPGAASDRKRWVEGVDFFGDQVAMRAFVVENRIDGVTLTGAVGEVYESRAPSLTEVPLADMWARLKACGWVMKRSTDAAKDKWRYFRPGADANEVPPEKAHFFYSPEDVRAFVDAERVDLVKRFGAVDEPSKKAAKRAKKRAPSPAASPAASPEPEPESSEDEAVSPSQLALWELPFKIMLKELLACGWTYRPGGALSYYWYFRPGAVLDKRIARPGVDYFTSEEDTIAFVKKRGLDGVHRTGRVGEDDDDDDGASDDGDDDDDMDDGDDDDAGGARRPRSGGRSDDGDGDDGDDDADDDDDDDAPPPGGRGGYKPGKQQRGKRGGGALRRHGRDDAGDEAAARGGASGHAAGSPGKAAPWTRPEPAADAAVAEADDGDDGDVADDDADDADDVAFAAPAPTTATPPRRAPDDDDDAVAESDGAAPAASDDDVACAEAEEDDEPAPDGLAAYAAWAAYAGAPVSVSARVFDAAYAALGNHFGTLYSALLKPAGWTFLASTQLEARGGLYVAPHAKDTAPKDRVVGVDVFRGADDVVSRVRDDPAVAEALRALAGDARESLKGRLAYVPDDDACVAAVALGVAAKRPMAEDRAFGDVAPGAAAYFKGALEAKADALWVAARASSSGPRTPPCAYKPAECEATTLNLLEDHARKRFGLWRARLFAGWSLWVSGIGSKYRLLEKFADEALAPCGDVVMIDGFDADVELRLELLRAATALEARLPPAGCDADRSTALGVARRLVSALNKRGDRTIFVVHSADGKRLRSPDAQRALAALRSETTHLVASFDHCNAPLLWDGDSEANWLAADGTTFDWFDREAPRLGALAGSADAAKGGAGKLLDTSGLEFVLLSLTPRHVEILKLLAAHQKALRDRPKHVKERPGADQAAPEGMLFKALKAECRYKMIAT